jgi:hypothetical protein
MSVLTAAVADGRIVRHDPDDRPLPCYAVGRNLGAKRAPVACSYA